MSRYVDPYPRWYTPLKWMLPLTLAIGCSLVVGLATMGFLPIPLAFGKLAWLPAIYASLDTLKAVALVGGLSLAVAAVVGLVTSFILRATVLFSVNELRGTQGQKAQGRIEDLEKTISLLHEEHAHNHALASMPEAEDGAANESGNGMVVSFEDHKARHRPSLKPVAQEAAPADAVPDQAQTASSVAKAGR